MRIATLDAEVLYTLAIIPIDAITCQHPNLSVRIGHDPADRFPAETLFLV